MKKENNNITKEVKEKEKKKPDKVLIALYIILAIVICALIYVKVKNWGLLPNNNKLVVELHDYFSASDLGLCDGLFNYDTKKMTYDDIKSESKLCIAYQKATLENTEKITYETEKVDSTCKVDDMIFKTDENKNTCEVTKIDRKIIDNSYKKLFGKDIENNDTFQYDGYHVCYLKDGYYYCGLSEYYTMTLGREVNVYRSIDRVEKKKDTITIYDYFAKVIDKECYKDYNNLNTNLICENHLDGKDLKYDFLKQYGVRYKHIYKKAKDGDTYYWVSSEPILDPNLTQENN